MQDPSFYSQIKAHVQPQNPQFAEQEHLKCPRCDSTNTKFCYYNNYNLSQPRYFCKSCRRYWTKGGALRNIPVGGSSRKNAKRSSAGSGSAAKRTASASESEGKSDGRNKSGSGGEASESSSLGLKGDDSNSFAGQFGNLTEGGAGGFGTLLGFSSSGGGHFGNFVDAPNGNGPVLGSQSGSGQNVVDPLVLDGSGNSDNGGGFLNVDGGQCWSGDSNEWTGLAMYTRGSTFHHKYLSK